MEKINWSELGFGYIKTDYNVRCYYRDGKWGELEVSSSEILNIHMAATCLHYGQESFEGLKAFRGKDGKIRVFRMEENGKRMQSSSRGIKMAELPLEKFEEAIRKVVKLNERFVPPYESGAALYIRPLMLGLGAQVGVKPAPEYMFVVFVTPVGPYFKGGAKPLTIRVSDYDRAAPNGTGHIKAGLNYAMSLFPDKGFVHKGPIHSSSDIGLNGRKLMNAAYPMGNSHGGMVCVKEQWYIFDHRRTGETTNRQPVAERIEIKEDGSISMVESTSCGLNDGPLRGIGTYPAYIACCLRSGGIFGLHNPMGGPYITHEPKEPTDGEVNVDTEADAPKARICGIKNGCVVGYKYFDLTKTKNITITVRGGVGIMEILGTEDGQSIGEIRISQNWDNVGTDLNTAKLAKKAGCPVSRCPIYLRYKGSGNVELLQFTLS